MLHILVFILSSVFVVFDEFFGEKQHNVYVQQQKEKQQPPWLFESFIAVS